MLVLRPLGEVIVHVLKVIGWGHNGRTMTSRMEILLILPVHHHSRVVEIGACINRGGDWLAMTNPTDLLAIADHACCRISDGGGRAGCEAVVRGERCKNGASRNSWHSRIREHVA